MSHICPCTPCPSPQGYRSKVESRHFAHHWQTHNNCLKNEKDNTVLLLPLQLTVTLFLGDKNSPYYKPGSIEELANHIVRYYLSGYTYYYTDKKKIKFSSYIRSSCKVIYVWLTASSYMGKYLCISWYIIKPFIIYYFATGPLWVSLYMRKTWFSFLSL